MMMTIKTKKEIPEPQLCGCHCGDYAKLGNKFINGHSRKNKKDNTRRKWSDSERANHEKNKKDPWNKGLTKETDERIAKQAEGRLGHEVTDKTRRKISANNARKGKPGVRLGKKCTKEQCDANSKMVKELWEDPDYCEAQSKSHSVSSTKMWQDPVFRSSHTGENAPNWQGGKSFEVYSEEFSKDLKMGIKERDNFTCRECDKMMLLNLHVHHVDYNKKNSSPDNLISLCRSCHAKTNVSEAKRPYWTARYQAKLIPLSILDIYFGKSNEEIQLCA